MTPDLTCKSCRVLAHVPAESWGNPDFTVFCPVFGIDVWAGVGCTGWEPKEEQQ